MPNNVSKVAPLTFDVEKHCNNFFMKDVSIFFPRKSGNQAIIEEYI